MLHPQISTEQPAAQASIDPFDLSRMHRGSLGAYSIARFLRQNHGLDDEALEARDQYGLLLALEFICYDLYAHHEKELDRAEGGGHE